MVKLYDGGTADNAVAAADILRGRSCGNGTFKMSAGSLSTAA